MDSLRGFMVGWRGRNGGSPRGLTRSIVTQTGRATPRRTPSGAPRSQIRSAPRLAGAEAGPVGWRTWGPWRGALGATPTAIWSSLWPWGCGLGGGRFRALVGRVQDLIHGAEEFLQAVEVDHRSGGRRVLFLSGLHPLGQGAFSLALRCQAVAGEHLGGLEVHEDVAAVLLERGAHARQRLGDGVVDLQQSRPGHRRAGVVIIDGCQDLLDTISQGVAFEVLRAAGEVEQQLGDEGARLIARVDLQEAGQIDLHAPHRHRVALSA